MMWTSWSPTWSHDSPATFACPCAAMPPSTVVSSAPIRRPDHHVPAGVAGLGVPELPYSRMNITAPIAKSANSRAPRS